MTSNGTRLFSFQFSELGLVTSGQRAGELRMVTLGNCIAVGSQYVSTCNVVLTFWRNATLLISLLYVVVYEQNNTRCRSRRHVRNLAPSTYLAYQVRLRERHTTHETHFLNDIFVRYPGVKPAYHIFENCHHHHKYNNHRSRLVSSSCRAPLHRVTAAVQHKLNPTLFTHAYSRDK